MLKSYVLLFLLFRSALCEKSFTLVIDTTLSMQDEINIFKANINSLVKTLKSPDIINYILLPYNDLEVGPPLILSQPEDLVGTIQFLEAIGGKECPEDTLSAIEKALEVSKPNSYIYVFTDAEAKSRKQLDRIKQLCKDRRSQVIVFQSGYCEGKSLNEVKYSYDNSSWLYYEIAESCDGSVFQLDLGSLRQVFKYIKAITKVDWSDINTHKEFTDRKQFTLNIDPYTKDVVVAVSGNCPTIQISNLFGNSVAIEKIVECRTMLVIRLVSIETGEYVTNINCRGPGHVTFYRRKNIHFGYGFSSLQPSSLQETASKPIPGIINYILISLPVDSPTKLLSVNIQMFGTNDTNSLDFNVIDENKKLYVATSFFEPNRVFKISIKCRSNINYQHISGSTVVLQPQETVTSSRKFAPEIKAIETEPILINFGNKLITPCKIFAYPKPDIWWENDLQEKITSESALLEIPSTYISYATINNVTGNSTITCKSKNELGERLLSIDIYVNRTFVFEVISYPTGKKSAFLHITVEYGGEGKLHCEVNAYPDAEIKWYHNDTLLIGTENIEVQENMILIRNMGLEETGNFKCVINHAIEAKTYFANVYVTGLEAPRAHLQNLEVILKPGDWTEQQCNVEGVPVPEVTWKYKSRSGDFDIIPEGVIVDENSIKIPSAATSQEGLYICEAENFLGSDSQEVSIKIQYPPKINNSDEVIKVRLGNLVELPCVVDAVPKADVHWDMYQDDVIVTFDEHHQTDDKNTHRFLAHIDDSGKYHCVAENSMGRAVRTVNVNVLVRPYIEPLPWNSLKVRNGTDLVLACDVTLGNPAPITKWLYITKDFDTIVLKRVHSAGKLDLNLQNISKRQEGTYQCVAENVVGPDNVKVYIEVI